MFASLIRLHAAGKLTLKMVDSAEAKGGITAEQASYLRNQLSPPEPEPEGKVTDFPLAA